MFTSRSSLAWAGVVALGASALGFGFAASQSPERTENVSIRILATASNNGEVEECG